MGFNSGFKGLTTRTRVIPQKYLPSIFLNKLTHTHTKSYVNDEKPLLTCPALVTKQPKQFATLYIIHKSHRSFIEARHHPTSSHSPCLATISLPGLQCISGRTFCTNRVRINFRTFWMAQYSEKFSCKKGFLQFSTAVRFFCCWTKKEGVLVLFEVSSSIYLMTFQSVFPHACKR